MVELGRSILVGAHPKRTITDQVGLIKIHCVKDAIDTKSKLRFGFVVGHADMVPAGIGHFEGAEDRECVLAIAVAECQLIATASKISGLGQDGVIEYRVCPGVRLLLEQILSLVAGAGVTDHVKFDPCFYGEALVAEAQL